MMWLLFKSTTSPKNCIYYDKMHWFCQIHLGGNTWSSELWHQEQGLHHASHRLQKHTRDSVSVRYRQCGCFLTRTAGLTLNRFFGPLGGAERSCNHNTDDLSSSKGNKAKLLAYLHIQQIPSNISIYLDLYVWVSDHPMNVGPMFTLLFPLGNIWPCNC